jgi:Uma2 family endonuclease
MVAKQTSQHHSGSYTVEDYDALPDDGYRYELIDGELIEMPAPSLLHQAVQAYLASLFVAFVMAHRTGRVYVSPVDVQLGGLVVQPDIVYVSNERSEVLTPRRVVGAPDLVVEILSPATRTHDLTTKREIYRLEGVHEYWVVDLEARSARVWALVGDRYVEQHPDEQGQHASTILPGFVVDVAATIAAVE